MPTLNELNTDSQPSGPGLWIVLREDLNLVWPGVSELLHRSPYEGALAEWEEPELYNSLLHGQNQLWLGYDDGEIEAVMITTLMGGPKGVVLWIVTGNGQLRKYQPYLEKVERWALMDCGAYAVKMHGSMALARVMRKSGYEPDEIVLSKPIRKLWSN